MKRNVLSLFLIAIACAVIAIACSQTAYVRKKTRQTTHADGRVERHTSFDARVPAENMQGVSTITVDSETDATISPNYEKPEPDLVAQTTTEISLYWSIGLAVAGVALFVAHRYFPIIPTQAPMGMFALAGILYAAPTLLDRYSGYLFAGGAAWLAWTIYSATHNNKLKKMPTERTSHVTG